MNRRMVIAAAGIAAVTHVAPSMAKTVQPSASGGLGNTRADFSKAYGKPTHDDFGDVGKSIHADTARFKNKKTNVELSVNFFVNKDNVQRSTDRAFDIVIYPPHDELWPLDQAYAAATKLMPKDKQSLGDLAPIESAVKLSVDFQGQTFESKSFAGVLSDPMWWTVDGTVGHFGLTIQQDINGSYNGIMLGSDARY